MLPYFQADSILIGPVPIQVWGLFVSAGVIAGIALSYRLARKYFFSPDVLLDASIWGLAGGFIGARLFYALFYAGDYYLLRPMEIFKFWQGGASSLGGWLGAALAVWLFVVRRRFAGREFLPYLDVSAVGLWLGWGLGRLGCFFIHDHPGRLSDFFLAVNFPAGARHDLGLYESLLAFLLLALCFLFFKRLIKIRWGLAAAGSFALYALVRFWLDFLRADDLPFSDPRYFGLTPAQWGMGTIFIALTSWLIYSKMHRQKPDKIT